jgi:hypothetical protein
MRRLHPWRGARRAAAQKQQKKSLFRKARCFFCPRRRGIKKVLALAIVGPFGENDVNEFVDARGFRARRVRFRNNLIDHRNNGGILMRIERAKHVAVCGMGGAKKGEKIGTESR